MRRFAPLENAREAGWAAVALWLLCFGLVAYLGIEGGGYDPLVHDQVGIAVWWILLAAVAVGALPRRRPGRLAWIALACSRPLPSGRRSASAGPRAPSKTSADLARVLGYLGVFALAILSRGFANRSGWSARSPPGSSLVVLIGLLSRLHPAWFPSARADGRSSSKTANGSPTRSNYWNGLAGLIAIGLPLLLQIATGAKTTLCGRLPPRRCRRSLLTLFFTLSRGGIAATVLAVGLFLALTSDRLPKLAILLVSRGGRRDPGCGGDTAATPFRKDSNNDLARHQGSELLLIVLVVCLVVGLVQAGLSSSPVAARRPSWTRISADRRSPGAIVAAMVCWS